MLLSKWFRIWFAQVWANLSPLLSAIPEGKECGEIAYCLAFSALRIARDSASTLLPLRFADREKRIPLPEIRKRISPLRSNLRGSLA